MLGVLRAADRYREQPLVGQLDTLAWLEPVR
jgi:hypothetical protein